MSYLPRIPPHALLLALLMPLLCGCEAIGQVMDAAIVLPVVMAADAVDHARHATPTPTPHK